MNQPIMRLFYLKTFEEKLEEFAEVGRQNFLNSLEKEVGTLLMLGAHEEDDETKKVVFEVYASQAAYQEHVSSEHFKRFSTFAQTGFSDRQVTTLIPEILLEKQEKKSFADASQLSLQLTRFQVTKETQDSFQEALATLLSAGLVAAGQLVSLAGKDSESSDSWYLLEIYQSESTYDDFHASSAWTAFKTAIEPLVTVEEVQTLVGELLISQGQLDWRLNRD